MCMHACKGMGRHLHRGKRKYSTSARNIWIISFRLLHVAFALCLQDSQTCLHLAARLNKLSILKSLIQVGKNVINNLLTSTNEQTYVTRSHVSTRVGESDSLQHQESDRSQIFLADCNSGNPIESFFATHS